MSAARPLPRRVGRRVLAVSLLGALAVTVQALAVLSDSEVVPGNTFETAPCFSAQVRSVQEGTYASTGSGATVVAITPVDPDRSFVLYDVRGDGADHGDAVVRVHLTSDDALTITRATDTVVPPTVTVQWTVVEYACGVRVQRGETSGASATTMDVAIAEVDLSQTFALVSMTPAPTTGAPGAAAHVTTSLPTATTLRLRGGVGLPASSTYAWQVIEFSTPGDARVQRVTGTLAAGAASTTTALSSAVAPDRTAVFGGATGASGPLAGLAARPSLSGGTGVAWNRSTATQAVDTAAWVVEFADGTTVQHGSVTLVPGDGSEDATITPVDPVRTTVHGTGTAPGGQAHGQTDHAGSVLGEVLGTFTLESPTTVRVRRAATTATSTFTYQAVQWGGPRWWDPGYGVRQQLTVDGQGADVPGGYTTSVTFDHAALVAAGLGDANGDDLRIARWDGSAWVELDRVLADGSSWDDAATTLWFRTVGAVDASGSDGSYWLYSGNAGAVAPPSDPAAVWLFADSFEDGDLAEYTEQPTLWYRADPWTYRRTLSVPAGRVAATLTDFPVLVDVTDPGLVGVARSDGGDIRFTAADGTTLLDHELVAYDDGSGAVRAWVELPSVAAGSATTFHLYAGAPNAPAQQDVHGTWSNGYLGVWHLVDDDPGADPVLTDSSPQDLDALADPGVASAAGAGIAVSGAGVAADVGPNLAPRAALTVSATVSASTPGTVLARGTGPDWALGLRLDGGTQRPIATARTGPTTVVASGGVATPGDHIALRADGTTLETLVDGAVTASVATDGVLAATAGADVTLGALPDGSDAFGGVIGEVRVSDVARSDAWLAAEAATVSDPGTFVSVGSSATGTWFDVGEWGSRLPVTLSATGVAGTHVDVPVLLGGSEAVLAAKAQASGADLVVTDADGLTRLPHELERFDAGSGTFRLWVRVPTLTDTADQTVYLYFDNPGAADQQDPTAVFAGDETVFHLADDPGAP